MPLRALLAGAAALLGALAADAAEPSPAPAAEAAPADRPIEWPHSGYVSSRTCRSCHPGNHETWAASYHRTMTQVATPEAVLAPFDGVELDFDGRRFQLERRGDEFWIRTTGPGDESSEERVALTTGSHHFQTYWLPTGEGRKLRLFEYCYYITEARWMPMDALPLAPFGSRQETKEGEGRWNKTCNRCHATGSLPRIFLPEGMDTRVGEFGIACEACHGPGARHVAANRDPQRRYRLHLNASSDPTIVDPSRLPPRESAQVCGQCHSVFDFHRASDRRRWAEAGFPYRPGDDLHATRKVIDHASASPVYRATKFWPDGQVRVNGREYNSLLESPCFQRGELSCLSCHALHRDEDDPLPLSEWADDQLQPLGRDNRACLQCHQGFGEPAKLVRHTKHAPDSPGSSCYNCHMPNTAWGLHKATRVHQIASPTATESLRTGRPNACNLCHLDKTLDWTARRLQALYGTPAPEIEGTHRRVAASVVWLLSGDAAQRALIAWHMGWEPARQASGADWMAPYLAQLLVDPYPAIRSRAHQSLRTLPGFEGFAYDFTAPDAERARARDRARAIWDARNGPTRTVGNPILVSPRDRLRSALFDHLLGQRDDRVVYLAE